MTKLLTLNQLDEAIRRIAWDCVILREAGEAVYCLLPPDPACDAAIAAAIGVRIHSSLKKPVLVNAGDDEG